MPMQLWDGEPAGHKGIVCYLSGLQIVTVWPSEVQLREGWQGLLAQHRLHLTIARATTATTTAAAAALTADALAATARLEMAGAQDG